MKNTIYIDIHLSEVIYEVKQTTHIKNVTIDNEESFKTASNLQVDSETDQLTYRCVGNAYAELKSRLSEYVNEQGTTANNKLFDEDSNVSVVLYVPTNFNLAVKDSIAASMHQFMVATSIREWYTITSKEDAKDYRLTGDEAIKLIIANINKRLRLTRGTLPNYANDIKGGHYDAENNAIVFTNDLGETLFSINLMLLAKVATSGNYADLENKPAIPSSCTFDESTNVATFKDVGNNTLFTVDLSALAGGGEGGTDKSLQNVSVSNGNIVFTFPTGKDAITLPISSIFNSANYYTKNEVYTKNETYDKTTIDNLIAAARNGGYVLVTDLPSATSGTVGKIYLVPKSTNQTNNIKDEYITIQVSDNYVWEKIGDTSIDLTNYYQKPANGIPKNDLSSEVKDLLDEFVIEVTSVSDAYEADMLFLEIVDAYEGGRKIVLKLGDVLYRVTEISASSCTFEARKSDGTLSILVLDDTESITITNSTIPTNTNQLTNGAGFLVASDITGKEDNLTIDKTTPSGTLNAVLGKYYNIGTLSGALQIVLPSGVTTSDTKTNGFIVYLTTASSGSITLSASGKDIVESGVSDMEASKSYELNFVWNGSVWAITAVEMKAFTQS